MKNYQNHLPQFASLIFFFHKTFPSTNPAANSDVPEQQTTSDPIKYHSRTTRQGGAPSLPPQPPLVSQSKYFSLFSNPDSCKNSSIIIILIIIYKNRSSFSLFFIFFLNAFFFSKQRDLLFGNSVIFFFFLKSLNVSSGKLTHPLPHPISLNPVRKNVMFCSRYKTKTMLEIPVVVFFFF